MEVLKTAEGDVHRGRIAGVFLLIALVASCALNPTGMDMCAARATFTIGWWLAYCRKRTSRAISGTFATPVQSLGVILLFLGVAGQFYVLWSHHH